MNKVEEIKTQRRTFFVGLIFAVFIGVLGNLAITSAFELIHAFKLNESASYSLWMTLALLGSIFLLVIVVYLGWDELKKNCNYPDTRKEVPPIFLS
ncbi:MAG: hypothetical protein M0Q92_00005 [Methanoregula sp.]|jgi:hypothetical protein|nr:hypothetical protein [Methanoregula sp.]